MPDEDYYSKFLRAAGQDKPNQGDPNEVLEIKITFPNDLKTFRKWCHWWLFIQICSCITFIMTIPGVISLNPIYIMLATPSATLLAASYILQRCHRELHTKLYNRYRGK